MLVFVGVPFRWRPLVGSLVLVPSCFLFLSCVFICLCCVVCCVFYCLCIFLCVYSFVFVWVYHDCVRVCIVVLRVCLLFLSCVHITCSCFPCVYSSLGTICSVTVIARTTDDDACARADDDARARLWQNAKRDSLPLPFWPHGRKQDVRVCCWDKVGSIFHILSDGIWQIKNGLCSACSIRIYRRVGLHILWNQYLRIVGCMCLRSSCGWRFVVKVHQAPLTKVLYGRAYIYGLGYDFRFSIHVYHV